MLDFLSKLFDTSDFPARWECGNWSHSLGWLHIVSDFTIFLSYAAIPVSLAFFLFRRRDVALRGIVWLFVAFILSCGLTHLTDATMFYYPAYRFLGVMKLATALISLSALIALIRVMPAALTLPGIAAAHRLAQEELERRKVVESELRSARDALEKRGALITAKDHRIEKALRAAGEAGVCWNIMTNEILWTTGWEDAPGTTTGSTGGLTAWSDILSGKELELLRIAAQRACQRLEPLAVVLPLAAPNTGSPRTLTIRALPDHSPSEQPTMTGIASIRDVAEPR